MIKYRIVKDEYAGFEIQYKRNWLSSWTQHGFVNTYHSFTEAKKFVDKLKAKGDVLWSD